MFEIIMQLHKSGSDNQSKSTKWSPTSYGKAALGNKDNPNSLMGNLLGEGGYMSAAHDLRGGAMDRLNSYIGSDLANYDFGKELQNAQSQITAGQAGISGLANGFLPSATQSAIQSSLETPYKNIVGSAVTRLGDNGILNSSITKSTLNNLDKNLSDSVVQQGQGYMGILGNLNNQMIANAGAGMGAAATAQDYATQTPFSLLNASIGAYNTGLPIAQLGSNTNTSTSSGSLHSGDYIGLGLKLASMF